MSTLHCLSLDIHFIYYSVKQYALKVSLHLAIVKIAHIASSVIETAIIVYIKAILIVSLPSNQIY